MAAKMASKWRNRRNIAGISISQQYHGKENISSAAAIIINNGES
jgi:hypothetical protein